jgi:hypothetical protein
MVINNNYEEINSTYYDNNSLDVNYNNNSEESEFNNNYIDQNLFKGAHVVLVSEQNPWYVNKGIPNKYISNKEFVKDIDVDAYDRTMNPQDIYKTEVKIDKTLPDLGLGHSFLQRKLAMDGIEQFNSDSSSSDRMNRNILLIVLVILIAIWLYRRYRK